MEWLRSERAGPAQSARGFAVLDLQTKNVPLARFLNALSLQVMSVPFALTPPRMQKGPPNGEPSIFPGLEVYPPAAQNKISIVRQTSRYDPKCDQHTCFGTNLRFGKGGCQAMSDQYQFYVFRLLR